MKKRKTPDKATLKKEARQRMTLRLKDVVVTPRSSRS